MSTELTEITDLDQGLRDIHLAGQHRDTGTDLANMLDLSAGLAAILPPTARHLTLPDRFDTFSSLLDWLATAPTVRLTHRKQLQRLPIDIEILHLVHTRDRGALTRDRNPELHLAHVYALDLDLARSLDLDLDLKEVSREICSLVCEGVVRTGVADLLRAITAGTRSDTSWLTPSDISADEHIRLLHMIDDFTGTDLRDTNVKHLDLVGVQWSKATRWPPADADWITAASDTLPNGNYIIRSADTTGGVVMPEVPITQS